MEVIATTTELENLCQDLSKHPFVTVDLEFLREHTYYAQLCLIQIGSHSRCAIVDPLAQGIDLSPFFALMTNPNVVKVFHSGRQDVEIIYNLSHQIPNPIFDTQIAGMVTGFGESISYENLVNHILHKKLDKSNRLSDWSKRPLNKSQLEYAISDVTHLVPIYEYLKEKIEALGRTEWIKEELDILSNPETYEVIPSDAWQRIKHRSHNAYFLTTLRELAAWRELRAQRKNTPRQSFIKDDILLTICAANPKSKEDLFQIRNLRKDIAQGRIGDEIVEVLNHAQAIPEAEYVKPPKLKDLPDKSSSLFELFKLLLKIISQEQGIVSRLLASDDDLRGLSVFKDKNNPVLKGWRLETFGKAALALRAGELSICFNPQAKNIVFSHNAQAQSLE